MALSVLRVAVFGAGGRMGRAICAAVAADPELELVSVIDPAHAGEEVEGREVESAPPAPKSGPAPADVAIDFTVASAVISNAAWCAESSVHLVIGTSGVGDEAVEEIGRMFAGNRANCLLAPNFAIGAVLMMRFAELAAPWFDTVEIIELHHDGKLDAPSGTATMTARRVSAAVAGGVPAAGAGGVPAAGAGGVPAAGAGGVPAAGPGGRLREGGAASSARGTEAAPGVRVHSVRLRGLVAHQEVLFGAPGQTLTIRHDSLDRASFMPGLLLAVKKVPEMPGFTVGLEALLNL